MITNKGEILITGDFCPINRIGQLVSIGDYNSTFNDFLPFIKDKDLAITNLECPLTETDTKINKYGPSLKAPVETAEILARAGFNLVTLANNHIMDYGSSGLKSTLQACKNNNIKYIGVGESHLEARRIFYTKAGNFTVAILNFAENEFSTTHGNYPGANPLDTIENYHDILEAKANADYVIVIFHGGNEMFDLPCPRIKKTFHFFADAGASAIFGHHTHCYSGYEVYKRVPIFYGLGNFLFDIPNKSDSAWNRGYAVELFLNNKITFNIIPYVQCSNRSGIRLMNDEENKLFYENITHLNSIILEDELLQNEFEKYCSRSKRLYFSLLEPHSIRLFHFLRNRKLFPSLLSKNKKTIYLNLLRCESHRDVLLNLLDKRGHSIIQP
jgi:poly-gamma-glutamate synthesis protein (capsule biosynthesis protein)